MEELMTEPGGGAESSAGAALENWNVFMLMGSEFITMLLLLLLLLVG